jgi:hypothetical protein
MSSSNSCSTLRNLVDSYKPLTYKERLKSLQYSSGIYEDDGMLVSVYNNKLRILEKKYTSQKITEQEYIDEKCKIEGEIVRLRKQKSSDCSL